MLIWILCWMEYLINHHSFLIKLLTGFKKCINPCGAFFYPYFSLLLEFAPPSWTITVLGHGYLTRSNVYGYYSASSEESSTNQQLWWSFNVALRNKGLLLLRCSNVVETGLEALLIAIHLYNHHTSLIRSLPGFKKCVSTQWSTFNWVLSVNMSFAPPGWFRLNCLWYQTLAMV